MPAERVDAFACVEPLALTYESLAETVATAVGCREGIRTFWVPAGGTSPLDLLNQIGKMLINFGMQALGKGIFPQLFPQALGGVMSGNGPVPLRKYARGGIANSPQLAMFGEGSTPEAYVPLPDGRSIPVSMKGGGNKVKVDSVNITVQNTGDRLSPEAQKQIANQVQGIVMSSLVNERRSGGLLR